MRFASWSRGQLAAVLCPAWVVDDIGALLAPRDPHSPLERALRLLNEAISGKHGIEQEGQPDTSKNL
jgi:hypothetical protein